MYDDLHFKTGKMGRLARFFARKRAAGDPYDETVVLPALIVIAVMRLNDLKRLDDWTVVAAVVLTAVWSGAWLGAALGFTAPFRVMLRGFSVGVIEAAAYAAIQEKVTRSEAFHLMYQLTYLNFVLFWFPYQFVAMLQGIATVSEEQWHEGVPRRAWLHKVIRITLMTEDLKGESTGVALTVWAIRLLGPPVLVTWAAWAFFGVSPYAFVKSHLAP
jgi:hypothetical protein